MYDVRRWGWTSTLMALALVGCAPPDSDDPVETNSDPTGDTLVIEDSAPTVDTEVPVVETDTDVPALPGAWSATLRSVSGSVLVGAEVWLGTSSAVTDAEGKVFFDAVAPGTYAYVAEAEGYSVAAGVVTIQPDLEAYQVLTVAVLVVQPVSDVAAGGSVGTAETDGFEISFPPSAFVDDQGQAVEGEVEVSFAVVDEPEEAAALPPVTAVIDDDGGEADLALHAAVEITPTQNGQEVSLQAEATLAIPVTPDDPLMEAEEIGLFSFDEAQGVWVWEAPAAIVDGEVVGTVTHFSWWAFGEVVADPFTCVTGHVVDANGDPVAGVGISASSASAYVASIDTTGPDGSFCLTADKETDLQVHAEVEIDGVLYNATVAASTDDADGTCSTDEDLCTSVGDIVLNALNDIPPPEDADGDGYYAPSAFVTWGWTDCDDTNAAINPGAVEVCDGIDQDCDGLIDDDAVDAFYAWPDADGDGYGQHIAGGDVCVVPDGWVDVAGDCDDGSGEVYPGGLEVCGDGIDQDCDGVDETCPVDSAVDTADTFFLETDAPLVDTAVETGFEDTAPYTDSAEDTGLWVDPDTDGGDDSAGAGDETDESGTYVSETSDTAGAAVGPDDGSTETGAFAGETDAPEDTGWAGWDSDFAQETGVYAGGGDPDEDTGWSDEPPAWWDSYYGDDSGVTWPGYGGGDPWKDSGWYGGGGPYPYPGETGWYGGGDPYPYPGETGWYGGGDPYPYPGETGWYGGGTPYPEDSGWWMPEEPPAWWDSFYGVDSDPWTSETAVAWPDTDVAADTDLDTDLTVDTGSF